MMDVKANEKSLEGEKVASTLATGEPLSSDSHDRNALAVTSNHTESSTATVSISKLDSFSNIIAKSAENTVLPATGIDPVSANMHAAAIVTQLRGTEDLPLILCSLSIDSLHCIASFLATVDWANFGQANHATNRVCNQVFRRVRMHGFRCATEVISAWVSCISTEWSRGCICLTIVLTFQSAASLTNRRNSGNSQMLENFQLYTPRLEFPSTLIR